MDERSRRSVKEALTTLCWITDVDGGLSPQGLEQFDKLWTAVSDFALNNATPDTFT